MTRSFCKMHIVRHGETDWNVKGLVQGHTDIPLNTVGKEQARQLAEQFTHHRFSAAYSSDLCRAYETAEILLKQHTLPISKSAELRERCYGTFEGILWKEFLVKREDHPQFHRLHQLEDDQTLFQRTKGCLEDIASRHLGDSILVVTHGGVIRNLLLQWFASKYQDVFVHNTAFIAVELSSEGVQWVGSQGVQVVEKEKG